MARRWSAADRQMPLCPAGSVVAGTDRPYGGDDPQVAHASQISVLARLTEEALQDPGLTGNPASYVHLLGTLLSFRA
jgi:hypothetical protein